MLENKSIGIVGGVGPFAGLDLNEKIFNQTIAAKDQDHLDIILLSCSSHIPDRTEFLVEMINENPAEGIFKVIKKLNQAGATQIGIPCNTAHANLIWGKLNSLIQKNKLAVNLVNMIRETAHFIEEQYPNAKNIGVLATIGTVTSEVYSETFRLYNLQVIYPDKSIQENKVHDAIYNTEYGIKAFSRPVSRKAVLDLENSIQHLIDKGCQVIVLGCTEIPLAITCSQFNKIPLVDPNLILARSLIGMVDPEKLKPLSL